MIFSLDFKNFVLRWPLFSISVISSLRFQFYIFLWCLLSVLSVHFFVNKIENRSTSRWRKLIDPSCTQKPKQAGCPSADLWEREGEARSRLSFEHLVRCLTRFGAFGWSPWTQISKMTLLLPPQPIFSVSCLAHPKCVNQFALVASQCIFSGARYDYSTWSHPTPSVVHLV